MILRLALVVLLVSTSFVSARAQVVSGMNETANLRLGGNNFIAGTVFFPNDRPVNRRMGIRLTTSGLGDYVGVTDTYGQFVFAGLPAGTYFIYVDREEEFEPAFQTIEIDRDREAIKQSYNVSIRLKDKANAKKKAVVVDSVAAAAPKRSIELYLKALELSKNGDHSGAIEHLKLAVAEYPEFINAYNEMGVQYMRLGQLDLADETLQKALKLKPDSFEPLLNRGIVMLRLKRYADSEALLRSALTANGSSAIAYYYLGRSLTALERLDEAEATLNKALELGGTAMKEAHRMLADLFIVKRNDQRAIEELEKYLSLSPEAPDADKLRKVISQLKAPRRAAPANKPEK